MPWQSFCLLHKAMLRLRSSKPNELFGMSSSAGVIEVLKRGPSLRRLAENTGIAQRQMTVLLALTVFLCQPLSSAELKPQTIEAFDRYVKLSQPELDANLNSHDQFLWIDRLPPDRRAAAETELHAGKVFIESVETLDGGKPIPCPGGMIHHRIGTVFIPGVTLAETLALVQNYDHHQDIYRPDVARSRILHHDGGNYLVYLRFYKKKVITSVVDSEHDIHYSLLDPARALSQSHTTRIQQVADAGKSVERLLPVGHDDGFLWKMNTYWRFEEKDEGTYVECQTISLTRDIPSGLGWLIRPYVTSVPRETLTFTLATTRSAVLQRHSARKPSS